MPVIDVDSHFEPTQDWLDEFPALKDRLPTLFPTDDPRFMMGTPEMFGLVRVRRPASKRSTGAAHAFGHDCHSGNARSL